MLMAAHGSKAQNGKRVRKHDEVLLGGAAGGSPQQFFRSQVEEVIY